ncbi:MAG: heme exporter protein CcmD [Rhodovibrionaceae bacterium]
MLDFLDMGGYAAFVWPCFGLAILLLGGFAAVSILRLRARQRELAALQAGRERQAP